MRLPNHRTALCLLALPAGLLLTAAQQGTPSPAEPPRTEPLPELPAGAAAVVQGRVITLEDYRNYLMQAYGRAPLRELIHELLLRDEAARIGILLPEAEVEAAVEEFWVGFREARHAGDEAATVVELESKGFDKPTFLANYRRQLEIDRLTDELCRSARVLTEEEILDRFELEYGVAGERVEVRHVFFTRGRLMNELQRQQATPDRLTPEALDAEMLRRATAFRQALRDGADFEELARKQSHDLSVLATGGLIPGYNYRRYGPEFAAAVRAAELNVPAGPIVSSTGVHVIEVLSRVKTELADVRDEVVALLRADPATGNERVALRKRLDANATVVTY